MGETLEQGTGVVVETLDGHRQLDNTLETRLKRMEEALRTPVYRILTGESA
jgi:vacuolar-type H+-ATPase subunit E/Vma4